MTGESSNTLPVGRRIRVGIIASGDEMPALLGACEAVSADLELVAIAGVPQLGAPSGVAWFDDTRVTLSQAGLDAVLLGVSPRMAVELSLAAFEKRVHVWRRPPAGRTFAEATELIQRARDRGVMYRIESAWVRVAESVRTLVRDHSVRPTFSEIRVSAVGPALHSFWSSIADAGGGVLMASAYGAIESLIAIRGLPESVFALAARCRTRTTPTPRATEDVALVNLRYSGEAAANIVASWDIPPYCNIADHHGASATLRIRPALLTLTGDSGATIAELEISLNGLPAELARFVADMRRSAADRALADADSDDRHVAVVSILESAYLSARTGQPEAPRQLYEAQRWNEPRR